MAARAEEGLIPGAAGVAGRAAVRATMRAMRRLTAALLAAAALLVPAPASAHDPAEVRIAEPRDGATVSGDKVRVVVVGEGGSAAATFRLDLDGRPVDATGTVDGVFTTLSVAPGGQVTIEVPMTEGEHQLTITPERNPDGRTQAPEAVSFQVGRSEFRLLPLLALLALLAVLGAAGLRSMKKARPGDFHNPGYGAGG